MSREKLDPQNNFVKQINMALKLLDHVHEQFKNDDKFRTGVARTRLDLGRHAIRKCLEELEVLGYGDKKSE